MISDLDDLLEDGQEWFWWPEIKRERGILVEAWALPVRDGVLHKLVGYVVEIPK